MDIQFETARAARDFSTASSLRKQWGDIGGKKIGLRLQQLAAIASLAEAVQSAFALAGAGDHIVLSPGFASFDMFRGYDDRGRQFEVLVENL